LEDVQSPNRKIVSTIHASVFNMYGPTETCITAIWNHCRGDESKWTQPLGRPVDNTRIYILDSYGQPVPIGVSGELCIGGDGLAAGYLNRPDLTAEKFIPNPFNQESGLRLYKTGDRAFYLPDGKIEFIGRVDHQVKIRGFRIEPGEIESALSSHTDIHENAVTVSSDASGEKRLTAYYATRSKTDIPISEIRKYLKKFLPDYMIPTRFQFMHALPLTANGKIDRKSLLEPEWLHEKDDAAKPTNPIEEIIADIWSEILSLDSVGIHDNFFEIGGHSLIATRIVSRLRRIFNIELSVRRIFESPTISELSTCVQSTRNRDDIPVIPSITPISRTSDIPLSFAQQRLWFLDTLEGKNATYNMPAAIRLKGSPDLRTIRRAFNEITRRHEILRTVFKVEHEKTEPVQSIFSRLDIDVPLIDLQNVDLKDPEAETLRLALIEAQKPFDLHKGPLIRAALLQTAPDDHVLLVDMHHIISDGWSVDILIREFVARYNAFSTDEPSPLPDLPIQYADFAYRQREWLTGDVLNTQLEFWKNHLNPSSPKFPTKA